MTPFFLFALLFLVLPTAYLVVGSFQTADGAFTLNSIANLFQPSILSAYWISIKISAASALLGALIGFFLAYAAVMGKLLQLDPADVADDLQRRGIEFRRHPACLRLPGHPRAARGW